MENFKKKSFTVLKYIAFGVVIGVLVGAIDTLFGRVLIAITDFRTDYYLFLLPFLPLAGLLITWMYNKFSAVSLKGMSLVFEHRTFSLFYLSADSIKQHISISLKASL